MAGILPFGSKAGRHKLSFLVNNLTNRMPDMDVTSYPGSNGAPYNSSNFDVLGRAYYLEAKWSFGKGK